MPFSAPTRHANRPLRTTPLTQIVRRRRSQYRCRCGPPSITLNGAAENSFTYDVLGDMLTKGDVGTYTYPPNGSAQPHGVTKITKGSNVTNVVYDADGNILTESGATSRTMTWTPYNMPLTVQYAGGNTLTFQYDADHNRVMQTEAGNTTYYLPDGEQTPGAVWHTYFEAGGQRVAEDYGVTGSLKHHYFHNDYQNTIGLVTDDTFNPNTDLPLAHNELSDVFGQPRYTTGAIDTNWGANDVTKRRYINQEDLTDAHLIDLNARIYDPLLGKFLSPDPVIADQDDSQSWNAYAYSHNNPMSTEDATGLDPTASDVAANTKANADTDPQASHIGGAEVNVGGKNIGHVSSAVASQIQSSVTTIAQRSLVSDAKHLVHEGMQPLTASAHEAIDSSQLDPDQARALTSSEEATGAKNSINPNYLAGLARKESSFDPAAASPTSTAEGLYQLVKGTREALGLSEADATGTSPAAITHQTEAAGSYLRSLMRGPVPIANPKYQFEIALGYYRGNRKAVNGAMNSPGGFQALLRLNFQGENFGQYLSQVEQYK